MPLATAHHHAYTHRHCNNIHALVEYTMSMDTSQITGLAALRFPWAPGGKILHAMGLARRNVLLRARQAQCMAS